MPNIAKVLKEEITRLARKEVRAAQEKTKGLTAQHHREIANLKGQVVALKRQAGDRAGETVAKDRGDAASTSSVETDSVCPEGTRLDSQAPWSLRRRSGEDDGCVYPDDLQLGARCDEAWCGSTGEAGHTSTCWKASGSGPSGSCWLSMGVSNAPQVSFICSRHESNGTGVVSADASSGETRAK